jgi:hypothetical protein
MKPTKCFSQSMETIRKDKDTVTVKNRRTGIVETYDINKTLKREISRYIGGMQLDDYLFPSRTGQRSKPITLTMAYNFLNDAAQKVGLKEVDPSVKDSRLKNASVY